MAVRGVSSWFQGLTVNSGLSCGLYAEFMEGEGRLVVDTEKGFELDGYEYGRWVGLCLLGTISSAVVGVTFNQKCQIVGRNGTRLRCSIVCCGQGGPVSWTLYAVLGVG